MKTLGLNEKIKEIRDGSKIKAVLTCDDSSVVFSTGHLTNSSSLEVLDGPRQPRLEDERPVTELSELTEAKREHVIL